VGDDVLVLAPTCDEVLHLSGSASLVFELLGAPRTLDELAGVFAAGSDAEQATIRAGLSELLEDLDRLGVVGAR
jgi:hypothetical protein